MRIAELFVKAGLCATNKEAKRLITSGGARIDDVVVDDPSLEVLPYKNGIVIGWSVDDYFVLHECSSKKFGVEGKTIILQKDT